MGVDWYSCRSCEETFPDCGSYTGCECGEHWCDDDCAEGDGYRSEVFEDEDGDEVEESSCKYCRSEDFSDYDLLNFSLELLRLDRKELISQYKASK